MFIGVDTQNFSLFSHNQTTMKLSELLQGKWLGHPVHAAVVHLPLAGWGLAALLDLLWTCGVNLPTFPFLSFYAVLFGLLGVLIAAPTGFADWLSIKPEKPAWKLGLVHMILNVGATVLWVVNAWLRYPRLRSAEPISTTIVILSAGGALFLLVSGYLGSRLAFAYGIGVGRVSKAYWQGVAAQSGAQLPPKN